MYKVAQKKSLLRDITNHRRHEYSIRVNSTIPAVSLCDNFKKCCLDNKLVTKENLIALYYPFPHEISTLALIEYLCNNGFNVALPYIIKGIDYLNFSRFKINDPLELGYLNVYEPKLVVDCTPSVVIAPLLCFDEKGNRLGYGGGYYDKTMARLRKNNQVLYIGVGYDWQQVEDVPISKHDVPLNVIITDTYCKRVS